MNGLHYEHDWQRKQTKYTVPQVDKGTSLHCYYVERWICMWHLFYTFLHNSSEGMFLCLPEELYILSAFFVSHVHSVTSEFAFNIPNLTSSMQLNVNHDWLTLVSWHLTPPPRKSIGMISDATKLVANALEFAFNYELIISAALYSWKWLANARDFAFNPPISHQRCNTMMIVTG